LTTLGLGYTSKTPPTTTPSGALGSPETLSEWKYCYEVTGTVFNLADNLTNAKDSNDVVWEAEVFTALLDLDGILRIRVLFIHEAATGPNVHVWGQMTTADDIE
jgi:hypothetical protein